MSTAQMLKLQHVPCSRCDYDLFGVPPEHGCPECGLAVSKSLDPQRLIFVGTRVLRMLRWALGVWLLASLAPFFVFACLFFAQSTETVMPVANRVSLYLQLCGAAVVIVVVPILITRCNPSRIARYIVIAMPLVLLAAFFLGTFVSSRLYQATGGVAVVLRIIYLIASLGSPANALALLCLYLLKRLPSPRMRRVGMFCLGSMVAGTILFSWILNRTQGVGFLYMLSLMLMWQGSAIVIVGGTIVALGRALRTQRAALWRDAEDTSEHPPLAQLPG